MKSVLDILLFFGAGRRGFIAADPL